MREGDFFTRHSMRPKEGDQESPDFEGVSEKGVKMARERAAQDIFEQLNESEKGTVMLLGAASDIDRTKSTALVYGDEIKNIAAEQKEKGIMVLSPADLEKIQGYNNKINYLADQIKNNPDKKIVLDFPLFLRELSFRDTWADGKGQWKDYGKKLLRRSGRNDEEGLKIWLKDQGKPEGEGSPNPKEVAKGQLAAVNRLREFAKKYIPNRPLIIGSVGHCWNLDALAIYLATKGEVTAEAFEKMKAKLISETGMIKLTQKDGKQVLQYGELSIPLEE